MAERAGAELGSTLHPADDATGGELVRDSFDEHRVVEFVDHLIVLTRRPRQLLAVDRWPPERMIGHIPVWVAEVNAIGIERSSERTARIARSGWDEHAFEAGLGKNPGIRETVERHTTSETQIGQAGFLMQRARHVHERVLENPLDAGGAIGEAPSVGGFEVHPLLGVARRTE